MSKGIRFYMALWVAKSAHIALKLAKRNATHYPGWVALKICPDFLKKVEKPETIIGVMGTNGKTTVSNMIDDVLSYHHYVYLNNRLGSNIKEGITTSLLKGCRMSGKMKYQYGVLEIDERSSRLILPYVRPKYIVVTNIFRDSIKRNAHTDFIFDILSHSIPDETTLILNSDDPLSNQLKPLQEHRYYSIAPLPYEKDKPLSIVRDVMICPHCGAKLQYDFHRYHHFGHVYCPNGDYTSPTPDYLIESIDYEKENFVLKFQEERYTFHLVSDNLINIYNQLAAISVLHTFGLTMKQLQDAFKSMKVTRSRTSSFKVKNSEIITHMCKGQNAVACSRVFDYVHFTKGPKEVIILLDDNGDAKKSSENLNWIYDADFELLNDDSIEKIIVGGKRCFDYKVRLLMAGIEESKIIACEDEEKTIEYITNPPKEHIFILHDIWKYQQCQILAKQLVERLK